MSMLYTAPKARKLRRMTTGGDLPDDVATLKAMLVEARASLAERDLEIERLNVLINKLKRMQFGRKTKQLARQIERLERELEDLTAARGVADIRRARASTSSVAAAEKAPEEALAPHLPREDHTFDLKSSCLDYDEPVCALGEDVSEQRSLASRRRSR